MISEIAFCNHYSSFWRMVTPTMDLFVRRVNSGLYDREFVPMASSTTPARRGFINEIAFALYCKAIKSEPERLQSDKSRDVTMAEISEVAVVVRERLRGLEQREEIILDDPTDEEIQDISEQFRRFRRGFWNVPAAKITPEPGFPGCGILDTCRGDVLADKVLYEIKAGDRAFRSIDFRQLMTYAALNHASSKYEITGVALFNPRIGIRAKFDIEEFCNEVSGKDSASALSQIATALSSGDVSR